MLLFHFNFIDAPFVSDRAGTYNFEGTICSFHILARVAVIYIHARGGFETKSSLGSRVRLAFHLPTCFFKLLA